MMSWSTVIEEGATVRQRQELIKLPDVSRMLAEIKIPEAQVRQVQPGMRAFVQVETLPGQHFAGTVRKVAILPDSQSSWLDPNLKEYLTEILIEDELPQLKPGVSARAQIIITNLVNVVSVPRQCVVMQNGQSICFVASSKSTTAVPITTGLFNDQFIEIKSGLNPGDRVLLAPISDPEEEEESGSSTNEPNATADQRRQDSPRPTEHR
jgi:HlyD family secretion protein